MSRLPEKIILIDVNGTLIADDSIDGVIPVAELQTLHQLLLPLRSAKYRIGLCSDSPLPELVRYAQYAGLDDLIVAENGNIISYSGQKTVVRQLGNPSSYKQVMLDIATQAGYGQPKTVIAPEFGGEQLDYARQEWGFGAHRETSVAVFAPTTLIDMLNAHFSEFVGEQMSIDCSPEHNYFAIHPDDYRTNKGRTLVELARKSSVLMIGNSASDWVEPASGVQCAFVEGARIDAVMQASALLISRKPLCSGVSDILRQILAMSAGSETE